MHLFDRVPQTLLQPLIGRNGRRTWDLVTRLVDLYFGPEVAPEYADGQLREDIVKAIERFLKDNAWEKEEGEGEGLALTPINIQANMIMSRLVDTGWFVEDKVGVRRFINMRPVVARFFETLHQFAVDGPQLVSGNIQLIHAQLKSVLADPRGQAPGFVSAAQLVVRLIHGLSTTTLRVRDLMKELTQEQDIPRYVERFFTEHIADIYVRDFQELRTANHPLRLRYDIMAIVQRVTDRSGPQRQLLLEGYRALPQVRPGEEDELLERDVMRFSKLMEVEKFLERMDRVMDTATQRAVAYINYRMRSSDRTESVILDSLSAVVQAHELGLPIEGRILQTPAMLTENRLRLPPPLMVKPDLTAMTKRTMTPRERALQLLRKEMISHRDTSPVAMKRYVSSRLPAGRIIRCDALPIETVEDASAFVGLMRLASISRGGSASIKSNPLLRRLGFEVNYLENERIDNEYFNAPAFTIVRTESPDAS